MTRSDQAAMLSGTAAAVVAWCVLSAAMGQTTAPATRPATAAVKPSGFAVRGRITIPAGWAQAKPDLSRAVVYLESAPELDRVAPPESPVVVAQHNKAFDPAFSVISRGTSVEFPNWDHFDHNVFSRSAAAPAFDLSRYPYGQSKAVKFEKVGAIQLFCNIHPEMRAMIFVTANPYFTRADRAGSFELPDVPSGTFELVVWNERCDPVREKITVDKGSPAELTIALKESRDAILAAEPGRARENYGVERGLSVKREQLNLPVVQGVHAAPVAGAAADRGATSPH